jgi:hypothetical protein
MEICQCDFCGIRDIVLPECLVCGKHMCVKHRFAVDFGIFELRERTEKTASVYKESDYICPECHGDRKLLYTKLAAILITEAEKIEELPPEEVLPEK